MFRTLNPQLALTFFIATALGVVIAIGGGFFAIFALLLVVAGVAILWNPVVGVMLTVLMMPFSATNIIPRQMFGIIGLNPFNAVIIATLISLLLAVNFRSLSIKLPNFSSLFLFFVFPIILAAVHGSFFVHKIPAKFFDLGVIQFDTVGGYFRDILLKPMIIIVVVILVGAIIKSLHKSELILVPIFVSAAIMAILVVAYVIITGSRLTTLASSESRGYLSWIGMHANEQGLFFNMSFALSFFTFLRTKSVSVRLLLISVISLIVLAIVLTFSRGAYIGFLVIMSYFFVSRREIKSFVMAIIIIILISAFLPQAVWDRASYGVSSMDFDKISAGRIRLIWEPLFSAIAEKPLFGHGLRSILWSKQTVLGHTLWVGHTHSAYLGLLLDFGIVGALVIALFYWKLWSVFRFLKEKHYNPLWRGFFEGASVCILVLLVQGVTDDRFTPSFPQSYMWIAAGLAFGISHQKEVEQPERGVH